MSRVGKLVFIEQMGDDGKPSYYNGEYLAIRETQHVLYCIKPNAGYDGHEMRQFSLVGSKPAKIISESPSIDVPFLRNLAAEMDAFAAELKTPEKRWVDYVYTNNATHARRIREIIGEKASEQRIEVPAGSKVVITITGA